MTASVVLHEGDNRVSLASLPENSIDAVVTDPPYSLTSITKRFGKAGSAPAKGGDGSFGRVSGGFMGKAWDATGIERDPEFWAAVYRVMKPGGCIFAFAGARTGHWQACAMEQAGFIMHPMHGWLYGQGFPKGHDASKEIDRHLGTTHLREVVDIRYEARRFVPGATMVREGGWRKCREDDGKEQTFAATTEIGGSQEARQRDGWKYGTQTQKPAFEPIYLGQKPFDGKPVESILKWGVGAFNIDGCRVPSGDDHAANCNRSNVKGIWGNASAEASVTAHGAGRYPANLLHDGSDEVVALFPEGRSSYRADKGSGLGYHGAEGPRGAAGHTDEGSAARFFNAFPNDEDVWQVDFDSIPPTFYHVKAGKADRAGSKHPTVKPIGLLRHLIRHICPPGGTVLDPFAGSGTTAEAARLEGMACVLMEQEAEYVAFLRQRLGLHQPESIWS